MASICFGLNVTAGVGRCYVDQTTINNTYWLSPCFKEAISILIYIYIYIERVRELNTFQIYRIYPWRRKYLISYAENLFENQQIYISPAPGRSSKLTYTGVEIDTCAFQTGCQLSSADSGMSLELRFWRNLSVVKRTCWTTGSWRSCLSLEVVSSIPVGSTIIYRFLCGFICVFLCQSIKIKPTNMSVCLSASMYVCLYRDKCIPKYIEYIYDIGHITYLTQCTWLKIPR